MHCAATYFLFITLLGFRCISIFADEGASTMQCRLPNSDSPSSGFVEYNCELRRHGISDSKAGIGNILTFYPSVYLFAMISGRDMVLHDRSSVATFCRTLKCGFPFLSDLEQSHVSLNVTKVRAVGIHDIANAISNDIAVADATICVHGLSTTTSNWYQYSSNASKECVANITGCDPSSVGCVERFAFRQLFPGGLRDGIYPSALIGGSDSEYESLIRSGYDQLKRFDGAVHIRAQLSHLEGHLSPNSTHMNSILGNYSRVFSSVHAKITSYYFTDNTTQSWWRAVSSNVSEMPRIFVTCDDVTIKQALIESLQNRSEEEGMVQVVYLNSSAVMHTRHRNASTHLQQAYIDTAVDWYLLSLTNVAFTWRYKDSKMLSTFIQSALRVSLPRPPVGLSKIYILSDQKWIATWDWSR